MVIPLKVKVCLLVLIVCVCARSRKDQTEALGTPSDPHTIRRWRIDRNYADMQHDYAINHICCNIDLI